MGIEEFDPISQPKKIRSAEKLRALSADKKLVLEARDTKSKEKDEYTQE